MSFTPDPPLQPLRIPAGWHVAYNQFFDRTSAEFWDKTSLMGMVAFMTLIFLARTLADSLIDLNSMLGAITSLLQLGR